MLEIWKRTFERDKTLEINEEYKSVNKKIQAIQREINSLNIEKQKIDNETDSFRNKVSFKNEKLEEFRVLYVGTATCKLDEGTCITCGQDLPVEDMKENSEKFNSLKAKQLEKNMKRGKSLGLEVKPLKMEIEEKSKDSIKLGEKLNQHEEILKSLGEELSSVEKITRLNKF